MVRQRPGHVYDSWQQTAGQTWTACVVYLPVSTDAQAPITVDHSLQGAWTHEGDNQLFAMCLDDSASLVGANCRWPHRFEVMGMQWGNPQISQERLGRSVPAGRDPGPRVIHRPGPR